MRADTHKHFPPLSCCFFRGISLLFLRIPADPMPPNAGYDLIKDLLGHNADAPANTPFWVKASSGLISGAAGAAIANPTDLIKVRIDLIFSFGSFHQWHAYPLQVCFRTRFRLSVFCSAHLRSDCKQQGRAIGVYFTPLLPYTRRTVS